MSITDAAPSGLHRAREASGCVEEGAQHHAPGYVRRLAPISAAPACLTALSGRSQYSNEAYDYPTNIRESFNDLGRTVSEKVQLLSSATSPAEAQAALTAPPSAKPQPKTFSHAVARAALNSSHVLQHEHSGAGEDPLATALEKFAIASEKVGEARLAQDAQIQSRFLAGWSTTLNTNIMFATRARKAVENARLSLDATKAASKGGAFHLPGQTGRKDGLEEELSEEARAKIEQAEDEFVGQTEEAVGVMKNVCKPHHPPMPAPGLIPRRCSTRPSRSATLRTSSPPSSSTTRRRTRSSRSSRPSSTSCRLSKRCVATTRLASNRPALFSVPHCFLRPLCITRSDACAQQKYRNPH